MIPSLPATGTLIVQPLPEGFTVDDYTELNRMVTELRRLDAETRLTWNLSVALKNAIHERFGLRVMTHQIPSVPYLYTSDSST